MPDRQRHPAGTCVQSTRGGVYYIGPNLIVTRLITRRRGEDPPGYVYRTLGPNHNIFWSGEGETETFVVVEGCPARIRKYVREENRA